MLDFIFGFMLKYAWFVFGIFALVQLAAVPIRAPSIAKSIGENSEVVRSFFLGYMVYVCVPYFVLGGIQVLGGFESAFYVFFGLFTNPYVLLAVLFILMWWALGAYFVYFRGGAKSLIRYGLVRGIGMGGENGVKVIIALGLIGGFLGLVVFRFIVPPPPF